MWPKMNPRDVVKHELIGLQIEVVDAKNKDLIGIKGEVLNETKNTITLYQKGKNKTILKSQVTLNIKLGNKIVRVKGTELTKRPEERIKK